MKNSLLNKSFHPVIDMWENTIDPYTQLTVVDERIKENGDHAVRFDNGKGAIVENGTPRGYVDAS